MAGWKTTTFVPGVTRSEWIGGYYLQGSKAALLAAGLARSEWFPAGDERDKFGRRKRTFYISEEGGPEAIRAVGNNDLYELRFRFRQDAARCDQAFRRFMLRTLAADVLRD